MRNVNKPKAKNMTDVQMVLRKLENKTTLKEILKKAIPFKQRVS